MKLKTGDKCFTWDNLSFEIVEIEVTKIEEDFGNAATLIQGRTCQASGASDLLTQIPIEWCQPTIPHARAELLEHLSREISHHKDKIQYLSDKHHGIIAQVEKELREGTHPQCSKK